MMYRLPRIRFFTHRFTCMRVSLDTRARLALRVNQLIWAGRARGSGDARMQRFTCSPVSKQHLGYTALSLIYDILG